MLLGANGAGKTSLLEAISGVIRAASGTISLAGTDITRMSRTNRSRGGVAHVEQGRSIFSDLTTEENLLVAGPNRSSTPATNCFRNSSIADTRFLACSRAAMLEQL